MDQIECDKGQNSLPTVLRGVNTEYFIEPEATPIKSPKSRKYGYTHDQNSRGNTDLCPSRHL